MYFAIVSPHEIKGVRVSPAPPDVSIERMEDPQLMTTADRSTVRATRPVTLEMLPWYRFTALE